LWGAVMKRVFALTVFLFLLLSGCAPDASAHPIPPPNESQEYSDSAIRIAREIMDKYSDREPQRNTSDMVNYLWYSAMFNAQTCTAEDLSSAINRIALLFLDDPWATDITMEWIMSDGALLTAAYQHDQSTWDYAHIGMNAFQSVADVYRGREAPVDAEDDYQKTIEGLLKVGIIVERAE